MSNNVNTKLFVSHSSSDDYLVRALLRLLIDGCGLGEGSIFCTSTAGTLQAGLEFIRQIEWNLVDCEKAILLITENYINSAFCMSELGALWIQKKEILPILVSPIGFAVLNRTPLLGRQAVMIEDENSLVHSLENLLEIGFNPSMSKFLQSYSSFKTDVAWFQSLCRVDSDGFCFAKVAEYQQLANNNRVLDAYRLDRKIPIDRRDNQYQEHWVMCKKKMPTTFSVGEQVKFQLNSIHEERDHTFRDVGLFLVPNIWGIDISLYD